MKKILKLCVTIFAFILITAYGNSSNMKIEFIEDSKHDVTKEFTYKFVGESNHFYFQTGKAYYGNNERSLLLSNFKVKDNVKEGSTFSVNLYFDDKLLYGGMEVPIQKPKDTIPGIVITEFGENNEVDEHGDIIGESDAFFETTMTGFKTSIRLEAEYCIKEQCTSEVFKIRYLK